MSGSNYYSSSFLNTHSMGVQIIYMKRFTQWSAMTLIMDMESLFKVTAHPLILSRSLL